MTKSSSTPVVLLELHTGDLPGARTLCAKLCSWRSEQIETASGSYLALQLGRGLGGGIVECGTGRATWLPYVEVARIDEATDLARRLGASVLLEPREGPAGRTAYSQHARHADWTVTGTGTGTSTSTATSTSERPSG